MSEERCAVCGRKEFQHLSKGFYKGVQEFFPRTPTHPTGNCPAFVPPADKEGRK